MLAFSLLVLTLAGAMARPRGVSEWIVAVAGALAMVAVGALTPAEAVTSIAAQWNVLLFFLGLMTTAAVAETSGVLAWLTSGAYVFARGRRDVLLLLIAALCVVVTATLSNDATILLLTPLVVRMVSVVGAPLVPYALACAYLANAASTLLPIANPTNVIVLEAQPLPLSTFLRHLLVPSLAAIAATVIALGLLHRTALGGTLMPERRAAARRATPEVVAFALGLAAVLAGYLLALENRTPIGPVAVVGGSLLTAALLLRRRVDARRFAAEIEWGIFPFFAGLAVVVAGAERAGLVDATAAMLRELGSGDRGPILVGALTALAANAMNNLPAAVLASGSLAKVGSNDPTVTAAVLLGLGVGPNFTTLGSLATIMWLLILRRRGLTISSLDYVRWSFVPSLAALGAALLTLNALR